MEMALMKGRPRKYDRAMKKTSIMLPDNVIEALGNDARKSGFKHWSQQLRYEVMKPRGMWQEITPYLPTQEGPGKA